MKRFAAIVFALPFLFGCSGNQTAAGLVTALDDSTWEGAEWISVKDAPVVTGTVSDQNNCRAADGANWFVSDVENGGRVVSAKWMTTALGVYDIYVNGVLVGEEILKPGFTHREKTKYSFTYDVTSLIKTGRGAVNRFSAQVTPGWWADKIVTPRGHDGMIGRKCAFRGVLELSFKDGSKKYFKTGLDGWKAGIAGPVKHAAIFDGEEYDAGEPEGFDCSELFQEPEINCEFSGKVFPTAGAEVYFRQDLAMKPRMAYTWKDVEDSKEGEYGKVVITDSFSGEDIVLKEGETLVVDFGQNASAVPYFEFSAAPGTELTCLPSEILNDGNGAESRGMDGPEGSVHRQNLRSHKENFRLKYTFGPTGKFVSFIPRRTFFGYRYISVTATGEVRFRAVRSVPVTSIAENLVTGKLTTGNELVNRLISNTVWGQYSNYLSVPTDCPQRNERLGWTADTQVFAETGTFFADTRAFFHKWMRDMRDSQSPTGAFPGVAPTAQYGSDMMRLGWADAGIIVPWTIWKQFADRDIVDENWAAMERFITHVDETRYDTEVNSSENLNYQWADWLSYEALESHLPSIFVPGKAGIPRKLSKEAIEYWNYLSGCYWILDAGMMAQMAEATGRDAASYYEMASRAREYVRSRFLNADGSFKADILNTMQTPALFALRTGVVDGAAEEAVCARLRENFAAHENCLQTGFLGTSILMETLTSHGMSDIAYELLFQRKNPSWLYAVDNGATTIWERWNSYTYESGMGPRGMNSFNHYAYGCVCQWIWERAAGIAADPSDPGFRHIIMKPVFDKRLGSLSAEYRSAAGIIRSEWKYVGDTCEWSFTVPEGSSASVILPGSGETLEYGPGSYSLSI